MREVPDLAREFDLHAHRWFVQVIDVERRARDPYAVEIGEAHALRQPFAIGDVQREEIERPAVLLVALQGFDDQGVVTAAAFERHALLRSIRGAVEDQNAWHRRRVRWHCAQSRNVALRHTVG